MGCSSGRAIQEDENPLAVLERKLTQFEELLKQFMNQNFSTTEEMNKLDIKTKIDKMQESINDSLRKARQTIQQTADNDEAKQEKETKLNEITAKSEELYAKNSNIIKEKLTNELNE